VALTYSKAGGPSWLTVESDGRISGIPTHADIGTNRFSVRVTNASGFADDATMTIVVPSISDLRAHYQFQGSATDSAGKLWRNGLRISELCEWNLRSGHGF
jgi:hypothetical protein